MNKQKSARTTLIMAILLIATLFSISTLVHPPALARSALNLFEGVDTGIELTSPLTSTWATGDLNSSFVVVYAYFDDPQMVADLAAWMAPWEVDYEKGFVVVGVTPAEYELLEQAGFRLEIDQALTDELNQVRTRLPGQSDDTIPGYPCYRTVEGTYTAADDIVNNYPNLASWIDVGDSWQKTQSAAEGYDMMVLVLTNQNTPGPKPKFFVTSSLHAREYTPAELNTRFAEYLVQNYNQDPDVTWLLDYHEIHLMLHANPDGRKKAETGLLWRKNTNNNYCSNTNNRGVDLNRNFEFQWNCCGGSSPNQCSTTYHGPGPASEPETQAIQNYMRAIFPDQRGPSPDDPAPENAMGIYFDIHSYSQLVLWPWGFTSTVPPNGIDLQTLGRKFGYFNGYYPEQAIGLYPTDGTTDDFAYGDLGLPAYTFELGTAFFQSCSAFTNTILPANLPALVYAAKASRTPYMSPAGPDALEVSVSAGTVNAGDTVTLTAQLNDTRFNNSNGTEPTQDIATAVYQIDTPYWITTTVPITIPMSPADGIFDTPAEGAIAAVDTTGWSSGRHTVFVRGQDANGNWGVVSAVFIYVSSGTGNIQGAVTLQGRSDHSGAIVTAWVGGNPMGSAVTDSTGNYTITVTSGTYDITVEADRYLDAAQTGVSVPAGSTITLNPLTLLGGDTNDDDTVNILDLAFMGSHYGLNSGDPGWDPAADINADGTVDLTDLTIATGNFNQSSPVPW